MILMIQYIVAVILSCAFLVHIIWKLFTRPWSHIPQPKGCLPILGHAFTLSKIPQGKTNEVFVRYFEELGDSYLLWYLWKPILVTRDIEIARNILTSMKHIAKGNTYAVFKEWLGSGIFTSTNPIWRQRRKALTLSFHFSNVTLNIPLIKEHCSDFIEKLKLQREKTVEFLEIAKKFQLGVISEIAMGIKWKEFSAQDDGKTEDLFVNATEAILKQLSERCKRPWLWNKTLYGLTDSGKTFFRHLDTYNDIVRRIVDERLQNMHNKIESNSQIFIDRLLNMYVNDKIDLTSVLHEVNSFMFAGHDTISISLSWTLYELGQHPIIQKKLYEQIINTDISEIIDGHSYLDCVINESLRLNPPGESLSRIISESISSQNFVIPAGTEVLLYVLEIHRRNEQWNNPLDFQPERFCENEKAVSESNFKFLPFSAGPRNCIGKKLAIVELKIILYMILSVFRVETMRPVEPQTSILRSSRNGFHLKFHEWSLN